MLWLLVIEKVAKRFHRFPITKKYEEIIRKPENVFNCYIEGKLQLREIMLLKFTKKN